MNRRFRILICLAALAIPALATAADPIPPPEREALLRQLRTDLEAREKAAAGAPSVPLLSALGDAQLFLGKFPEAVASYRRMIELDPAQDAPHWRLGIAYLFNQQPEESSRQFAKYHPYDGRDRENGLWKFLADVKAHSLERARAEMLDYKEFDREPFPNLYELFAGRMTPERFDANLTARKLTGNPRVMFFAHYYSGLFQDLLGHREEARQRVAAAVALFTPGAAGRNGPGYMWQVARLHYDSLAGAK